MKLGVTMWFIFALHVAVTIDKLYSRYSHK